MCRSDASSWNLPLVRRGDEATTPFLGEMPASLLSWVRMLLILPRTLYIPPKPFLVVVFAATAANWAAAWAEAHTASDISLLIYPWSILW